MELNEADENDYSFYDFWLEIQCSVFFNRYSLVHLKLYFVKFWKHFEVKLEANGLLLFLI